MLFFRSHECVSSPKRCFVFEAFSHVDGLHQGWGTCVHAFFEFRGLNKKLDIWVWVWTLLEFPLKAKNVIQSIVFAKHALRLESWGTFVHQYVVPIERACLLEQAGRCVMLWHSQCCVCIFLNVKKEGNKQISSSICFLTILFCVFAFADNVGFHRIAPLLCTYQHKKGAKMW